MTDIVYDLPSDTGGDIRTLKITSDMVKAKFEEPIQILYKGENHGN
jgi:hypothetical protein